MIFENQLERVWPRTSLTPEERKKRIHAFAKANKWQALIYDPGLRVRFRELTPLASIPAGRSSPDELTDRAPASSLRSG